MKTQLKYCAIIETGLLGLILLCSQGVCTLGQSTFVVPDGSANVEGDGGTVIVFNSQFFIRPSGFPALPGQAVYLTGLSFRADVTPGGGSGHVDFGRWDIALSTNPQTVPSNFLIPGEDRVVVHGGGASFDIPFTPRPGPAPFSMGVTFQTPFLYRLGSALLVELNSDTTGVFADYSSGDGSCCFSVAGTPQNHGQFGGIPVMQFSYVVPEASPERLLLLGFGIILICGRRGGRVIA